MCLFSKAVFNKFEIIFLNNKRFFCAPVRVKRVRSKMDINLKCRENPVVTTLDTPEFKNVFTQEVQDLKKLFDKYGFEIRIAGGAVRDLLMGLQPKDLDFATVATPHQMKEMFTKEEVRMINMNGEKHGTITPRINNKENFEVTTLRIDMITDGRHAEVEFTTDWKLDANRRDLTINSMFLAFDGSVYDYFFGYEDLQKRKVSFVGDPDVRIKEDYLRILRYYRFYGRISQEPNNHDQSILDVISKNVSGLQNISGERIWTELKKILQGNFAGDLLKNIIDVGLGKYIGLPKAPNLKELNRLLECGQHLNLDPMSLLASLLNDMDEAIALHNRLKFSSYDRDLLYFIIEHRDVNYSKNSIIPYQKLILHTILKKTVIVEYVLELLKYKGEERLLENLKSWEIPRFPVSGQTLKENKVTQIKLYSLIMTKLKDIWIENSYKQTAEELAKFIPSIIEELEQNQIKRFKKYFSCFIGVKSGACGVSAVGKCSG